MKQPLRNPVIPEGSVPKRHCMVCQKAVEGWYGAWGDSGTCSKKCEQDQASKPLYPDHPEKE